MVIQVQVRNNFIKDVFLNGGFGVNIITKKLSVKLGLSKPKPWAPYNLCMADQTDTKTLGLFKDFKILVHGIFHAITFTIVT